MPLFHLTPLLRFQLLQCFPVATVCRIQHPFAQGGDGSQAGQAIHALPRRRWVAYFIGNLDPGAMDFAEKAIHFLERLAVVIGVGME